MQQQLSGSTLEVVAQTTADLKRLSHRLIYLLSFVPDDKLTWAPSVTAKSPLAITAHCALVSRFFASVIIDNLPEQLPSPEDFFQGLNKAATEITTREAAIALVEETTEELGNAMATISAENITTTRRSPFGPISVQFWMSQGPDHLAGHVGQVEYLQTIWGDLDNHLN